jgi:hypothetical protein
MYSYQQITLNQLNHEKIPILLSFPGAYQLINGTIHQRSLEITTAQQ